MQIMRPERSTGRTTEILIVLTVVLALAGLADVADRFDLVVLQGTVGKVLELALPLLSGIGAAFAARRREGAKRAAQAERDGAAGA